MYVHQAETYHDPVGVERLVHDDVPGLKAEVRAERDRLLKAFTEDGKTEERTEKKEDDGTGPRQRSSAESIPKGCHMQEIHSKPRVLLLTSAAV